MASGRSRKVFVDPDQQMAEAMKQVKKAMKQVKEATRGMDKMNLGDMGAEYHPPPDGYSAPPPKTKYTVDGSAIKVEKSGVLGKNTRINIQNSKNVQIGNNNVMVVNQSVSRGRRRRGRHDSTSSSEDDDDVGPQAARGGKSEVLEEHRDLLSSERLVNDQDVRTASKFMAKSWRRIGRALSVPDAELEQIYMDYSREEGIQGVGYHVIQAWRQKSARGATLGVLTSALCKAYPAQDVLPHFQK